LINHNKEVKLARYRQATGNSLLRAYNRAVKGIEEEKNFMACERDAGFIMPKGWPKGHGYQVFVKVCRFSQVLLDNDQESGGLLVNAKPRRKA